MNGRAHFPKPRMNGAGEGPASTIRCCRLVPNRSFPVAFFGPRCNFDAVNFKAKMVAVTGRFAAERTRQAEHPYSRG